MEGIATMNLSDPGDGMVAFRPSLPAPPPITAPEKNTPIPQQTMDSTPIADLMGNDSAMETMYAPQQAMYQNVTQAQVNQGHMVNKKGNSSNPMNLTDEQMEALFAGVVAAIAFSDPVQAKLQGLPNFLAATGERSMTGLLISGLVAAIIFYFARSFVLKH